MSRPCHKLDSKTLPPNNVGQRLNINMHNFSNFFSSASPWQHVCIFNSSACSMDMSLLSNNRITCPSYLTAEISAVCFRTLSSSQCWKWCELLVRNTTVTTGELAHVCSEGAFLQAFQNTAVSETGSNRDIHKKRRPWLMQTDMIAIRINVLTGAQRMVLQMFQWLHLVAVKLELLLIGLANCWISCLSTAKVPLF